MRAILMVMGSRCWTKVKKYLFFGLSQLIIFAEKRQELTLLSTSSSYLRRSKKTKDPENPEIKAEHGAMEVTLIST